MRHPWVAWGTAVLAGISFTAFAVWHPVVADQREVGIDPLNTTAVMKSWVVCGFTEGFNWPESTKKGSFRIGVLEDRDLLKFLMNNCNMHLSGSQIVEVSACPELPDDTYYHILYVGDVESAAWKAWRKVLKSTPTVVVTHQEGGVPEDAVVNFHFVSGTMKLQLDADRAAELNISIGNELKSWEE